MEATTRLATQAEIESALAHLNFLEQTIFISNPGERKTLKRIAWSMARGVCTQTQVGNAIATLKRRKAKEGEPLASEVAYLLVSLRHQMGVDHNEFQTVCKSDLPLQLAAE